MRDIHSRIGEEIEAYCGRCRLDRIHRVVAQDSDGTVRKIICGMCNSYRNYRPPKPAQVRSGKRESARSSSRQPEDLGPPSRNYNMKDNFELGEVIFHPSFGVGKVVTLRDQFKIEVKFSDGIKILLQNR